VGSQEGRLLQEKPLTIQRGMGGRKGRGGKEKLSKGYSRYRGDRKSASKGEGGNLLKRKRRGCRLKKKGGKINKGVLPGERLTVVLHREDEGC